MYQQSMFEQTQPGARFLGNGCFGHVWSLPDGWVRKVSNEREGTLNYLEWCVLMQAAGKGMRGMPEIDRLVHTVNGYMVTMREYGQCKGADHEESDTRPWAGHGWSASYIIELMFEFSSYMVKLHGEKPGYSAEEYFGYCNDRHAGNIMHSGTDYILTDPSGGKYYTVDVAEELVLH